MKVFPGLHIADELRELLNLVMVEKVSMTKDRSSIRIYIVSPRLIHKKNIYSLEDGIAKQLFPGRILDVKIQEKYRLSAQYTPRKLFEVSGRILDVKIQEKYRLSAQYTPRKLFEVYKDSIQTEFKRFGMLEYNILRRAKAEFAAEDSLVMTIEDNLIYRERSKEVARVLEKIFTERCGLTAEVKFEFTEPPKKEEPAELLYEPFGKETAGEDYLSGADAAYLSDAADGQMPWEGGRTAASKEKSGNSAAMSSDKAKKAPEKKAAPAGAPKGQGAEKKKEFGKKTFGEFKKGDGGSGFKRGEGGRPPYRKSEPSVEKSCGWKKESLRAGKSS